MSHPSKYASKNAARNENTAVVSHSLADLEKVIESAIEVDMDLIAGMQDKLADEFKDVSKANEKFCKLAEKGEQLWNEAGELHKQFMVHFQICKSASKIINACKRNIDLHTKAFDNCLVEPKNIRVMENLIAGIPERKAIWEEKVSAMREEYLMTKCAAVFAELASAEQTFKENKDCSAELEQKIDVLEASSNKAYRDAVKAMEKVGYMGAKDFSHSKSHFEHRSVKGE
jgi:hypothetical protein